MNRAINILTSIYKKHGYKFQGKIFSCIVLIYKKSRVLKSIDYAIKDVLCHFVNIKVYSGNMAKSYRRLLSNVEFDLNGSNIFVYSWDIYKSMHLNGRVYGNCTIDYGKILDKGLIDLCMKDEDVFTETLNSVINSILEYIDRLKDSVENSRINNKENICRYLTDFQDKPALSLEEALQRILIINQLQWQTGHILVGLGRLDYILERYEESTETAEKLFEDFFKCLHKYYEIKSNALMGDTGQIIVLAGCDAYGNKFCGRYTRIIANVVRNLNLPDPKILIRTGDYTDSIDWDSIVDYILHNRSSVLLSNDTVIVRQMADFGYDVNDARGYITAACWEPIASGCYEQNNILSLNFLKPFERISYCINKKHMTVDTYEEFLSLYFDSLDEYVTKIGKELARLEWNRDPFYTLFDDHARNIHKDVGEGGSKYNNIGIMTVAMGNAVNAIANIRELVYVDKKFTYKQLDDLRLADFYNHEELRDVLKKKAEKWGKDDPFVYDLANTITKRVVKTLNTSNNAYGGRYKIGLSSPHYIMDSIDYPASFDGRKKGEPFSIHISGGNQTAYTEVLNLASRLEYSEGRFNGDVVDLIVSARFMEKNKDAFAYMFGTAFRQGVCQLQVNLLDSETLIKAKADPESFPELIVRVWGFNAYFNELPEEYKDYLIERAVQSELTYK